MPRRLKETAAKVQDARDSLENELQRSPTVQEIAEKTGLSEEDIIEALEGSKAYGTFSLDRTFEDGGDDGEGSALERYTGFDEKGYDRVELAELIDSVVSGMSERNKYIFRERFLNNRSQSEIARELGVSQMTVSRAERNMVEAFRKQMLG